ncbi:glycoside hydrolase family 2 protein [Opitutus terrae]|uniref:beta-mannosidase n=1 Tax=Opitutus terrae (strain DSM 11246 / JCM 15787 / PB90-1) TaxID=452637 RepID=B2A023_OPITP|nr:glycoside hydrolase family 2 TIM barrel-domain containing protein [Opitutus terrae]ACB77359.1 glycoside hydrolase family 2 immunoglobulin domain protein beta-sandwich [Opitutus terrae PB90-1]
MSRSTPMVPCRRRYPLLFQLGRQVDAATPPTRWVPAHVPGAVQLDWARATGLHDYTVGDNVKQWADLDESYWTYRSTIDGVPLMGEGERLYLVFEGIDYAGEIGLDGRQLCAFAGMQTPIACDVTGRLRAGSVVTVHLAPAPKSRPEPRDRTQADATCKPAVSYGWDFHPRLIPLGIWREAYLDVRPAVHFAEPPHVNYELSDDLTVARGAVEVRLNRATVGPGWRIRWTLTAPDGSAALQQELLLENGVTRAALPFSLAKVLLWWPHDQGTPILYASRVELIGPGGTVVDRIEARVGFRRVRLVMAPDQWKHPGPTDFPKSRSYPPVTLEINGRATFAKGSNWVGPDIFPGAVTAERLKAQLTLARGANFNLLRMWGGAAAPQDLFYELCDELGIMVWQEFPLACNRYPDTRDYLVELDRESRSLIVRLRPHAAVVLWCGGNELFNSWSGMTDQSRALRLLNRNCYELDPARPFLASSPVEGVGHGHYVFRDPITGREGWEMFQAARCTAYTEFGCPATPSADTLRRILPGDELWPPRAGTAWETHHAFGAWLPSSHLYLEEIEHYFGPSDSLEQLVERAQLLQSEGLRGMFEEARRQKPVASMALNWCFNEPWPGAANNSLVAWPCEPKPALVAVGEACRPTLASARVRKFSWSPGEVFDPELWLLHDGPDVGPGVEIVAWLESDGARQRLGSWATTELEPNQNQRGPCLEFTLPEWAGPRFTLRLEVAAQPGWNTSYTLIKARGEETKRDVVVPQGATNF